MTTESEPYSFVAKPESPSSAWVIEKVEKRDEFQETRTNALDSISWTDGDVFAPWVVIQPEEDKHTGSSWPSGEGDSADFLGGSWLRQLSVGSQDDPISIDHISDCETQELNGFGSDFSTIVNWLDGISTGNEAGIPSIIICIPKSFYRAVKLERGGCLCREQPPTLKTSSLNLQVQGHTPGCLVHEGAFPTVVFMSIIREPQWFAIRQKPPKTINRWPWPVRWKSYTEFRNSCEEALQFRSQQQFDEDLPNKNTWDLIDAGVQLQSDLHQTSNFDLGWDVLDFVKDQLDDPRKLRSLFIVAGTEDRAWASNCLEYARTMWSDSGEQFLEGFIALIHEIITLETHNSKFRAFCTYI